MKKNIRGVKIGELSTLLKENKGNRINRKGSLHYCPPSGGGWGVVRVACQVPEILILFVVPKGCGRHGAIASIKNGTAEKVRYLLVEEVDLVVGSYMDKTKESLKKLIESDNPKGVILFSTCMDDLLGSDFDGLAINIEEEFNIPVVRGKMNPMMSESSKPPDLMIQKSIYEFLKITKSKNNCFNQIGCFNAINPTSEIHSFLKSGGVPSLSHITSFKSFEDYKNMADSAYNLLIRPLGIKACKDMENRLGIPYISVISAFRPQGIMENYTKLLDLGNFNYPLHRHEKELNRVIKQVKSKLKGQSIVIGSTINADPFELALFLIELNIDVKYILAPVRRPYESSYEEDLKRLCPDLTVIPNLDPSLADLDNPIDFLDIGIGLDTPVFFKVNKMLEVPFDETLYGFKGSEILLKRLLDLEEFNIPIKELVYRANLVI